MLERTKKAASIVIDHVIAIGQNTAYGIGVPVILLFVAGLFALLAAVAILVSVLSIAWEFITFPFRFAMDLWEMVHSRNGGNDEH